MHNNRLTAFLLVASFALVLAAGCSAQPEPVAKHVNNLTTGQIPEQVKEQIKEKTRLTKHETKPQRTAPISGLNYQSLDTQRLQADAFANPGMLAVDAGERLWNLAPTDQIQACAGCHAASDDKSLPMQGVALRYPKVATHNGALENLEQRINRCRSEQQQQPKLVYESADLLALTAYVAYQSQGLEITAHIQPEAQAYFEAGRDYYYERRGQMNLACHHCHELNSGRQLRGDRLSQGHSNGYPAYRLEWQTLGSLHRRLRFCNLGVRAEPHPYGAQEYVNLELYLRWRAAGLSIETPAVRR